MKKRWVLFDLGNVLVHIDPPAFTRSLGINDEEARERYREKIIGLVTEYERGLFDTSEYLDRMSKLFDNSYDKDRIESAMNRVIADPLDGMEELVRAVSETSSVALVSNTNQLHFEYSLKKIPALRFIQKYFLSYEMKTAKPSQAYYARVLNELNTHQSEIIFIDDLIENIQGAESAGMIGIRFENTSLLKEELTRIGVLKATA